MTVTEPFLPPSPGREVIWDRFDLPLGSGEVDIVAISDGEAVLNISFGPGMADPELRSGSVRDRATLAEVREQLRAYVSGELQAFDLPLRPVGTVFQLNVWRALMGIPFGTTSSYGEVASSIGRRGSGRAVGSAVGANPIAIVIPCHRVIGADGSLTGYGGGMENKVALLTLEGVLSC
jgi:methylated-DNA-[protein]-cysteine S-methyltransferase